MVKNTTISLIQSMVALTAIITNASLQTDSLVQLNKTTFNTTEVNTAKKLLLGGIISQFIAALLMIIVFVLSIMHRDKVQQHSSKFIYTALIISGILLLVSGAIGASVAVRLQCYRGDTHINKAWEKASVTAVMGIVGALLMLMVQAFIRKDSIKGVARDYLTHEYVRVPTHKPVGTSISKKAPMPVHHPQPYKKDSNFY